MSKIGKIIAYVLAGIIIAYGVVQIIIIANGSQDYPMTNNLATEDNVAIENIIQFTFGVLILFVVIALITSIINIADNIKKSWKGLAGVGALLVLMAVVWGMTSLGADAITTEVSGLQANSGLSEKLSPSMTENYNMVSFGLYATFTLLALTVLGVIANIVKNIIK